MFITPVHQVTVAPALHQLVELPPLKRNDIVIERTPSGMLIKARVVVCFWDETMGAEGEWTVYLKFHPMVQDERGAWVQDTTRIQFTWTSPKVCEKEAE